MHSIPPVAVSPIAIPPVAIPRITIHRRPSLLRSRWRPLTGALGGLLVAAVLMTLTTFAQPSQHGASALAHTSKPGAGAAAAPIGPTSSPTVSAAPADSIAVNTTTALTIPGTAPKMPWPRTGQSAIAIGGGNVLGVSGRQAAAPTASMAKAMTAYIVLKDHPLRAGTGGPIIRVTPAEAAAVPLDIRQAQQILRVRSGEALTEAQALNALMLKSANNVARILARWDAGSIPAFLAKMNATAKQFGMASTHYTDPSGWDARTLSTTTDQIRLAEIAMQRSDFARIVGTKSAIVPIEGRIRNVNPLLGQDGIVGIKTGSMSAAGGCLMFAAKHIVNNKTVWILGTVMGQRSNAIGDLHQAFASSKSLVEAMERVVGSHIVVHAGQVVGTVPGTTARLVATKDVAVVGWGGMKYNRTIQATVPTSAKTGASVGTLTVTGGATVSVPVALQS